MTNAVPYDDPTEIHDAMTTIVRLPRIEAFTGSTAIAAESGGALSRAGTLAARGAAHVAGAATEAGIITVAQVKMQSGSAGDAFFTNLLQTVGANAIGRALSKDLVASADSAFTRASTNARLS